MAVNWKWPGWTWLENTGENAASTFAATLLGAMGAAALHTLHGVDWPGALSQAGFAALTVVLASVASLRVSNGTASFLPSVVAAPQAPTRADG